MTSITHLERIQFRRLLRHFDCLPQSTSATELGSDDVVPTDRLVIVLQEAQLVADPVGECLALFDPLADYLAILVTGNVIVVEVCAGHVVGRADASCLVAVLALLLTIT